MRKVTKAFFYGRGVEKTMEGIEKKLKIKIENKKEGGAGEIERKNDRCVRPRY